MGQNCSNINENINIILVNVNKKYSTFININFIDILLELYSSKFDNIEPELLNKYCEIIFKKKANKNDLYNYIKNKLILIFKINKSLLLNNKKLKVIYGNTWNSKITTSYKCHIGSLYYILNELQSNSTILTNKDLKSYDENYQISFNKIEEFNKSLFIDKLQITKKEKNMLLNI